MGLPVIPFAQLILHERDEEAERDPESHLKKLRRKSNDLKKELSDFRFRKNTIDEEDEDESRTKNKEGERIAVAYLGGAPRSSLQLEILSLNYQVN